MKISAIRKIYSRINSDIKNIHWQRVETKYLENAIKEKQKTSNCYLNATKVALFNSTIGKKILKERLKKEKNAKEHPAYQITLSPNGKKETYRVSRKDYFGKFFSTYRTYNELIPFSGNFETSNCKDLNLAYDIAVSKMITKNPKQKPWYLRIFCFPYNKKYEYNRPSLAFEWLTGIKPIICGSENLFGDLNNHKEEALKLLETLGNMSPKDYSFILMSGKKRTPVTEKWHCLPITKVNNETKRVWFIDKRYNCEFDISFDTVLHDYKTIVGINWKDKNIQH